VGTFERFIIHMHFDFNALIFGISEVG